MMFALKIAQIIIAVLLVVVILLQNRGSGMGSAFGGSSAVFTTKRGLDKKLYNITIVLAILFFAVSLAVVII
ncbi:preprotein translocase subunit SecG [Patescibacteria group bacterium]|jgi:preprotein translocase subunit SecG|nr:preprotein translocase subunit SecG [Patescibacteria group bacterium]